MNSNFIVLYSKDKKTDFLIALMFLKSATRMLIVAQQPFPIPFFNVLREIRGRMFVAIVQKINIRAITELLDKYEILVLSDMHLNNFELAFVSSYCRCHNRKAIVFVRELSVPFASKYEIANNQASEVFYENFEQKF